MGARTEYPTMHEKRNHKHYLDVHACFGESMEDKIKGLGEFPFSTPSESKMTWLNEEIEEINIGSQETPHFLKMGKLLEEPLQNELIQSFHDYSDLFAWSYKDMPRLDENFVVHNLVVEKGAILVKQKPRKIPFQVSLLVKKEEVGKEREIYFISKTLKEYETRYTPIKMLCQCIVFAIEILRHYMINSTTDVLMQTNPLRYLMSKTCLNGRLAKWIMLL